MHEACAPSRAEALFGDTDCARSCSSACGGRRREHSCTCSTRISREGLGPRRRRLLCARLPPRALVSRGSHTPPPDQVGHTRARKHACDTAPRQQSAAAERPTPAFAALRCRWPLPFGFFALSHLLGCPGGEVVLLSTDTGAVLLRFTPAERNMTLTALALSPSRRELLVCGADGSVAVWPLMRAGGARGAVGLGAMRVISGGSVRGPVQAGAAQHVSEETQRRALACDWGSVRPVVLAGA